MTSMSTSSTATANFRVLIAGGGVAALEAALALLAPADECVYRPLRVKEPFAYAAGLTSLIIARRLSVSSSMSSIA